MKPRVFIGSSREGEAVAYALQTNLDKHAEVTVWTQGVFKATDYNLESLGKELAKTDVGIFVFSADDVTRMRGAEHAAVRDNVIFEFGLAVGHLGREKSIIVLPESHDLHLPSDLLGVNVLKYQADRKDGNLDAALGPASKKIRDLLADIQPKAEAPREFKLTILERKGLLSQKQRDLLSTIEAHERCSTDDLAKRFPNMPAAELYYRLEQLRLLMFISVPEPPRDGSPGPAMYALSEGYKQAARGWQYVRTSR